MPQPDLPALSPAAGAWVGWFMARGDGDGQWEPVLSAESETEAWRRLIAFKPVAVPHCAKMVLPRGRRPWDR